LHLTGHGIDVVPQSLRDDIENDEELLKLILCYDIARHHGADRDRAGKQMSERIRSMIDCGRAITVTEYENARASVSAVVARLEDIIGADGLFLTAATIDVAPLAADGTGSRAAQRLWTLAGMPAITIPYGKAHGLPIGIQLVGPRGHDDVVLNAAQMIAAGAPPSRMFAEESEY